MTEPARPQDEAHMKPHKGTIRDWVELPCRGGLGYYIAGHSIDHPQFGGGEIYTSWVVKHDRATNEIETNNSRYTLIEPHGRKPPPAPVVEGQSDYALVEKVRDFVHDARQQTPGHLSLFDMVADYADTFEEMLKAAPSAPDAAVVAEIEKRHLITEDDIRNNFGAAYSTRITQDVYSLHKDRATLLRLLKSGGARTVGTVEVCANCGTSMEAFAQFGCDGVDGAPDAPPCPPLHPSPGAGRVMRPLSDDPKNIEARGYNRALRKLQGIRAKYDAAFQRILARAERAETDAGHGHCRECKYWTRQPGCQWGWCDMDLAQREQPSWPLPWAHLDPGGYRGAVWKFCTYETFGCVNFAKKGNSA